MITLSKHAASAATDAVCDLLNGGSLKIYNDAGVLLAEPRFEKRAFKVAIDGLAESYPLEDDDNASASGEAKRFSACDPAGDVIFSGTVGDDLKMDNPHIAAGARVQGDRVTFSFRGE
jgi:hypothetical protein